MSRRRLSQEELLLRSRLRNAYKNMKRRCFGDEVEHASYRRHGIRICDRWLGEGGKSNFMSDMGPTYEPDLTLERIDPHGDYEPSNCTWVAKGEQAANRTNTVWVELDGERMCLKHALVKLGRVDEYERIYSLIAAHGMSFEDAINRPPGEYRQTTPVMYHGQEYPSLGYLIRQAGHGERRQTIYKRVRSGMSIEDAIDTPIEARP